MSLGFTRGIRCLMSICLMVRKIKKKSKKESEWSKVRKKRMRRKSLLMWGALAIYVLLVAYYFGDGILQYIAQKINRRMEYKKLQKEKKKKETSEIEMLIQELEAQHQKIQELEFEVHSLKTQNRILQKTQNLNNHSKPDNSTQKTTQKSADRFNEFLNPIGLKKMEIWNANKQNTLSYKTALIM